MTDLAEPSLDLGSVPVELVHWPADAAVRDSLARAGVPRMLLVAADAEPPATLGVDEDWVRMPATAADVIARARQLLRFDELLRVDKPFVDEHRVLHRAGMTVHLSAAEAAVRHRPAARRRPRRRARRAGAGRLGGCRAQP